MPYLSRRLGAAIVRSTRISVGRALPRHARAACFWSSSTARPRRHASGPERVRGVSA